MSMNRDVGASMYDNFGNGLNNQTRRLDLSIDCLKLMIQAKIFNQPTHEIGLILFGTEESVDYNTLYVSEIQKPNLAFYRNVGDLGQHEKPERLGGDIFDALDKAVHTLDEVKGKIKKKIFILTCGCGETEYNDNQLNKLMRQIKKVDVKINLIAIDFMDKYNLDHDDPDKPELYESLKSLMFSGTEDQTPVQNQNQKQLYLMQEELRDNMRIFPVQIAFELYSQFRTRQVAARASFRGEFKINEDVSVQILIYKKTTEEKLPSLKKFSTVADFNNLVGTNEVRNDSTFYLQDDIQMQPVDKENMIKGYQYGKQIVPVDSLMEEKMKYKCPRSFALLGFVEKSQIARHYFMSSVDMVVAIDSEKSKKQMSALITALIATKKVALARFVGRDKGSPKLVVLLPHKNDDYECFWMIQLPTVEDIRNFQFSTLRPSTVQQQQAVGQLIDSMDLTAVPNEDGELEEILKMKHIVNPTRQYFQQVVMHKAITQSDQIPPISNVILEYLKPEQRVYEYSKQEIEKIKSLFKFKKHEIKKVADKKVFWKQLYENEQQQRQVGDDDDVVEIDQATEDISEMMAKQKFGFDKADEILKEIGTITPQEDFKKMISEKRMDLVETALIQIQKVIIRLIDESLQGNYYQKAIECLKEMRKACISEDETDQFNHFLLFLRERYQSGSQELFWANVVKEGITLISKVENNTSNYTVEQAAQFLIQADQQAQVLVDKLQNDEEELLAEIE